MQLFNQNIPFFRLVGDPVRLQLLSMLVKGEALTVRDMASRTQLTRPTISHHLKIMKDSGVVVKNEDPSVNTDRRENIYMLQPGPLYATFKELIAEIDRLIEQDGRYVDATGALAKK